MKDNISIYKSENSLEYLSRIKVNEVDSDFVLAMSENSNELYAIALQGEVVGFTQMFLGRWAFVYIYIFPEYRHKGCGSKTLFLLERYLKMPQLSRIMTGYRSDVKIAGVFAEKCGYKKEFAVSYMMYSGIGFEEENLPVRKYKDEDYEEVYTLDTEAFHVMRRRAGFLTDSTPSAPSQKIRRYWAETADERFVYMMGNRIVGYVHIEGEEIDSISVKLEYQGKGIGKKFVKYIVNKILGEGYEKVSLCCVVGNTGARCLFEKLGFVEVCCNDYAVKEVKTCKK